MQYNLCKNMRPVYYAFSNVIFFARRKSTVLYGDFSIFEIWTLKYNAMFMTLGIRNHHSFGLL